MYKQTVALPIIFQVNEGIIEDIPLFLNNSHVNYKKLLLVTGNGKSLSYANIIVSKLQCEIYTLNRKDETPVEDLIEYCKTNEIDILLGVGGGYVLDVVKRVSLISNIENFLVPTIISNDGLMSPISVIEDSKGKTHSLPGKMPSGIIVDLDIVVDAPKRFLQAAAGDILSNISATNDWVLAKRHTGAEINDLAYMLSRSSAFALIHHESKDLSNRSFLKQVVNSQISSGLAMALAGNSRPCSGSEHLISHSIDYENLSEHTLHGLQVGSISIFCLYLQKKLDIKCINYAKELDMPFAFHSLNSKIISELELIYETALVMRPGRFTVLDTLKSKQVFAEQYFEYLNFLERFKL